LQHNKADYCRNGKGVVGAHGSTEADLTEDALAGQQLGTKPDYKAEHGKAAIPSFSESDETEAWSSFSHGCCGLFRKA